MDGTHASHCFTNSPLWGVYKCRLCMTGQLCYVQALLRCRLCEGVVESQQRLITCSVCCRINVLVLVLAVLVLPSCKRKEILMFYSLLYIVQIATRYLKGPHPPLALCLQMTKECMILAVIMHDACGNPADPETFAGGNGPLCSAHLAHSALPAYMCLTVPLP
jgi:hypothetical protein